MTTPPATAARIVLAGNLDLKAAAPLREALRAVAGRPLDIDGSAVQRLGGLCLQVLAATARDWRRDGKPLRLVDPSPEFADALRRLGAGDLSYVTFGDMFR